MIERPGPGTDAVLVALDLGEATVAEVPAGAVLRVTVVEGRQMLDLAPVGLDGPPVDHGDQRGDGEEHDGEHLTKLEAHPARDPVDRCRTGTTGARTWGGAGSCG